MELLDIIFLRELQKKVVSLGCFWEYHLKDQVNYLKQ